ncbi:acyl carrier protein [Pantoea alhagi]|uniref:acyl carrier protein n=1 Tax=Mixta sp. BE291 TaxID=3158787 RepID=UPI00285D79D7|nr:acyl carrier protein [Pantoea alhagi]
MKINKVNAIIAKCASVKPADIHPDLSLVYDLHMDSIMFTEMICFLEDEFSVTVAEEDIMKWYCVQDVYNYFKIAQ